MYTLPGDDAFSLAALVVNGLAADPISP